ncbi:MAG TPA: hypothetical protein VL282_01410 [Tepidisphaeraceae bacterium]|nr:hypothetical protein [Tepidisphaeraceae bacterium]
MRPNLQKIFVGASVLLFIVSLTQIGFYTEGGDEPSAPRCFGLLLVGWLALFERIFAWLANPALIATWVLLFTRRPRSGAICAIVSLALSLSFLLHRHITLSESGNVSRIVGYGPGYWLWVSSIATVLIGSVIPIPD